MKIQFSFEGNGKKILAILTGVVLVGGLITYLSAPYIALKKATHSGF